MRLSVGEDACEDEKSFNSKKEIAETAIVFCGMEVFLFQQFFTLSFYELGVASHFTYIGLPSLIF